MLICTRSVGRKEKLESRLYIMFLEYPKSVDYNTKTLIMLIMTVNIFESCS
jgi:hypothetical protein